MFKNIFKIIKYDVNTQIVIFNKIKITFKNNAMKKILKDIEKENNFEDYKKRNVDITQVPQAKGILREKQLKCLEILKKVANICDENNIPRVINTEQFAKFYKIYVDRKETGEISSESMFFKMKEL